MAKQSDSEELRKFREYLKSESNEDATFEEQQKLMEALESKEELAAIEEPTTEEETNKPLEFEEINGVTFLKGTKFVISKIL
jgi:hypothetical protein